MLPGVEYVRNESRKAAALRLIQAATFVEAHTGKILFQRTLKKPGGLAVLVRFDWPGVLRVFDPNTGEQLAESAPGQPQTLASPDA